ncbi:uncharacterized protein LOC124275653 isoform X4 [Haliotis rubra]|uniref:uncharacterized protein LOC124275653 isoform X4 n=1 Tax=Haliotis rubra TaxID=36100 RepID=UPI001EE529A6|nr:uncharacterized protein LOC124275653 isoform X4 [Haliotis rubra]
MTGSLLLIIAALLNTIHAASVPTKHGPPVRVPTVAAGSTGLPVPTVAAGSTGPPLRVPTVAAGSTGPPVRVPTVAAGSTDSTVAASSVAVGDPNCKDSIPNCDSYSHASCTGPYESWAKSHCQAFCGFCIPITSPFVCADKVRCKEYGADLCSNPDYVGFVEKNCVKYCHLCPGDVTTTPIPKTGCFDDFERCDEFGKGTCTKYPNWSQLYCSKYCGICKTTGETDGVTVAVTTAPASTTVQDLDCFDRRDCSGYDIKTSCCGSYEAFSRYNCARHCRFCDPKVTAAPLCTDTIDNCKQYNADLCTNPTYDGFVKSKCAGFCKLCDRPVYYPDCTRGSSNGSSTAHPGQTTPRMTPQSTPSTTPTPTTPPQDKCMFENKYYSEGETWFSKDCRQKCTCKDAVNDVHDCGPPNCPKWIHNCDLILPEGACCPILKCNYFQTIHGPGSLLGGK